MTDGREATFKIGDKVRLIALAEGNEHIRPIATRLGHVGTVISINTAGPDDHYRVAFEGDVGRAGQRSWIFYEWQLEDPVVVDRADREAFTAAVMELQETTGA